MIRNQSKCMPIPFKSIEKATYEKVSFCFVSLFVNVIEISFQLWLVAQNRSFLMQELSSDRSHIKINHFQLMSVNTIEIFVPRNEFPILHVYCKNCPAQITENFSGQFLHDEKKNNSLKKVSDCCALLFLFSICSTLGIARRKQYGREVSRACVLF